MPLFPRPSLQPPEALKPSAYFTSDVFVKAANQDVEELLIAWEEALSSAAAIVRDRKKGGEDGVEVNGHAGEGAEERGRGEEGGDGEELSPFRVFKAVFAQKGWTKIHLAVVDQALRKEWFETLTRLILENVQPGKPLIRQVGALFAAYAVWGTQPEGLGPKYNLRVDLELHRHILNLPRLAASTLDNLSDRSPPAPPSDVLPTSDPAASADPAAEIIDVSAPPEPAPQPPDIEIDPALLDSLASASAPPDIPAEPPSVASSPLTPAESAGPSALAGVILPSHSLYHIVSTLVQRHAFVLVPDGLALNHPTLPTMKLVEDITYRKPSKSAAKVDEADAAVRGEDVLATEWELARWAGGLETSPDAVSTGSGWNCASSFSREEDVLSSARRNYVSTKSSLARVLPSNAMDVDVGGDMGVDAEKAAEMEREVLKKAAGMTLRAMQSAGSLIDQLLPGHGLADGEDRDLAAFRLVDAGRGGVEGGEGEGGLREWVEARDAMRSNAEGDKAVAAETVENATAGSVGGVVEEGGDIVVDQTTWNGDP